MSTRDILMLVVSFLVVGGVVLMSQRLHKQGAPLLYTRKIVHVVVGCWIIPSMLLFDHSWVAAIPSMLAVIGNTVSHFTGIIGAIELKEAKPNYGTLLYPASFVIVLLVFFPTYNPYWYAGMLGILIMTFGDTAASLYGRKYGKGKYTIMDETRTIEGSMAMLITTFIIAFIIFAPWNLTGLSVMGNLILALMVATVATVLEAISIRGWDNFLVPIGSAFFTVLILKMVS